MITRHINIESLALNIKGYSIRRPERHGSLLFQKKTSSILTRIFTSGLHPAWVTIEEIIFSKDSEPNKNYFMVKKNSLPKNMFTPKHVASAQYKSDNTTVETGNIRSREGFPETDDKSFISVSRAMQDARDRKPQYI